jgi:hypothetical protein
MNLWFQDVAHPSGCGGRMTATHGRRPAHPRRRDDTAPARAGRSIERLADGETPPMPEGHRDCDGFWFPAAYATPVELFTAQQRRAQARQREARRGGALTPPEASV